MRHLVLPILLLGLGDSLNPTTIGVAILLAAQPHPVPRLLAYTFGTALTYFLGGLIVTLGPAQLLDTLLHHHSGTRTYIAEIVVGVGALGVAAWLWTRPAEKIARRLPDEVRPRHALGVGAGITLVDLPTALMYFGAIAIIVAAEATVAAQIGLLVIFNVAYVVPLLAITALVGILGDRASAVLARLRDFVMRWSTRLLAMITGGSGCYLIFLGIKGLAS